MQSKAYVTVNYALPTDVHERLATRCAELDCSASDLVRRLLFDFVTGERAPVTLPRQGARTTSRSSVRLSKRLVEQVSSLGDGRSIGSIVTGLILSDVQGPPVAAPGGGALLVPLSAAVIQELSNRASALGQTVTVYVASLIEDALSLLAMPTKES